MISKVTPWTIMWNKRWIWKCATQAEKMMNIQRGKRQASPFLYSRSQQWISSAFVMISCVFPFWKNDININGEVWPQFSKKRNGSNEILSIMNPYTAIQLRILGRWKVTRDTRSQWCNAITNFLRVSMQLYTCCSPIVEIVTSRSTNLQMNNFPKFA